MIECNYTKWICLYVQEQVSSFAAKWLNMIKINSILNDHGELNAENGSGAEDQVYLCTHFFRIAWHFAWDTKTML